MIYLIDDKKNRQEFDYGWNSFRLKKYSQILQPIYYYTELIKPGIKESIFSKGNVILFHESFFENSKNNQSRDSVDIRAELIRFALDKNGWVVFFSGSKSSRKLQDKLAHIPVSVLYKNLEDFLQRVTEDVIDLNYLLFGLKNPEIEAIFLKKLSEANNQFDETIIISESKNFLALAGNRVNIPVIIKDAVERTFKFDENNNEEITQSYLNEKVVEWFSIIEVDNIFIPLCFGPSLSDMNGIQFACHIRCTETINQLKPIFIYSFVDYPYLLENEYFHILQTKNVFLIDYTRLAFKEAISANYEPLTLEQLSKEIQKLKLDVPKNYEDRHSISNEWAIYLWSSAINTSDEEIEKIIGNVKNNLYFKYLKTINPVNQIPKVNEAQLKIKYSGEPKLLYIDDDAEKGWYEVFCTILHDFNNLEFQHIDEELQGKTREEIIKLSIEKIEREDIDLVLLDFRLHPDDFNTKNIQDITGLKLLSEIKKTNPGVRVIIFSATNKIWNLIELQNEGADAFIIKESPDTAVSSSFTKETIEKFSNVLQEQLEYVFLKELFNYCQVISQVLSAQDVDENEDYDKFIKTLLSQIRTIRSSISLINMSKPATIDIVFLSCFNFLELFKTYYLNENKKDYRYYIGIEEEILISYNVPYRSNNLQINGEWLPNEKMRKPTWFNTIAALFIDYLKVSSDPFQEVIQLARIAEWRNDYIHNSKEHFTVNELKLIFSSLALITSKIKE